ncbi:MAG: hypothetical protein QM758_14695 [Armatimonas sp.]
MTLLTVDEAWTPQASRLMFVSSGYTSCGYHFTTGHDYTIFAHPDSGQLWVSMCGLTTPGLPGDYKAALGPSYRPVSYAAIWWGIGGTLWLTTFVFLKLRSRRKL